MNTAEWHIFLQRWTDEVLASEMDYPVPDAVREARWLGFAPAAEAAIAATEARLGRSLPPSLREFYSVSNGWRRASLFKALECSVRPVEDLGWLADREPHLYKLVSELEDTPGPFKNDPEGTRLATHRYEQGTRVKRSLLLGAPDSSYWLLDPGAEAPTGSGEAESREWPGGIWAHYHPAMEWRAASFALLMIGELDNFLKFREMR